MSDRSGKHIAVFGKTNTGKTELVIKLTQEVERLFVVDPKGSWAKKPGFEVLEHWQLVKPFLSDMGDAAFRVVYIPETAHSVKRLSTLSKMFFDIQRNYFWGKKGTSKLTLVVDELADCFPTHIPDCYAGFRALCRKGREYGVNIVGITQRPATVHNDFKGNLSGAIAFRFSTKIDRQAVADAMEDDEVKSALIQLEPYSYIEFDSFKWEVKPPIKF